MDTTKDDPFDDEWLHALCTHNKEVIASVAQQAARSCLAICRAYQLEAQRNGPPQLAYMLISWTVGKMRGDAGTGEAYWGQFPEYRAMLTYLAANAHLQ